MQRSSCRDNGLAECRGRRKHAGFVLEKRGGGLLCSAVNSPRNRASKGPSLPAFVPQLAFDAVPKKLEQIVETPPREGDVFREQLGTRDDAWLAESR